MSENVQMTLIIVAGIVAIIIFALAKYDKLGKFSFSASKKSIKAKMEADKSSSITVSGNTQLGNQNKITAVAPNTSIENNQQLGDENTISTAASSKNK